MRTRDGHSLCECRGYCDQVLRFGNGNTRQTDMFGSQERSVFVYAFAEYLCCGACGIRRECQRRRSVRRLPRRVGRGYLHGLQYRTCRRKSACGYTGITYGRAVWRLQELLQDDRRSRRGKDSDRPQDPHTSRRAGTELPRRAVYGNNRLRKRMQTSRDPAPQSQSHAALRSVRRCLQI